MEKGCSMRGKGFFCFILALILVLSMPIAVSAQEESNGSQVFMTGTASSEEYVYDGLDYSPVFNAEYYLAKYADLRNAFGTDKEAAFRHFIKHGMKEGRQASENFDVHYYKTSYKDLQKAFGNDLLAYYLHYIKNGKAENRKAVNDHPTTPEPNVYSEDEFDAGQYELVFNAEYYLEKYSDLRVAFDTDKAKAFRHFLEHGMNEGRQASENFDVYSYQARYEDLRNAFGSKLQSYYVHYICYGHNENRLAVGEVIDTHEEEDDDGTTPPGGYSCPYYSWSDSGLVPDPNGHYTQDGANAFETYTLVKEVNLYTSEELTVGSTTRTYTTTTPGIRPDVHNTMEAEYIGGIDAIESGMHVYEYIAFTTASYYKIDSDLIVKVNGVQVDRKILYNDYAPYENYTPSVQIYLDCGVFGTLEPVPLPYISGDTTLIFTKSQKWYSIEPQLSVDRRYYWTGSINESILNLQFADANGYRTFYVTANLYPDIGYVWEDGTTEPKTFEWRVYIDPALFR